MTRTHCLLLLLCLLPVASPAIAQRLSPEVVACSYFGSYLDPDRAIAACTRVIDRRITYNPDVAYSNRGLMHAYKDEYDLALSDFDASIRLNPGNRFARLGRAMALRNKGDYNRALADVEAVLRLPLNSDERLSALLQKAQALRDQGAYDAARAQFEAVMALYPTHAWAYAGRALTFRAQGATARALEDFDRALALEKFPLAYVGRAGLHESLGNLEQAKADYAQALALMKPSMTGAKLNDFSFRSFQNMARVRLELLRSATSVATAPPVVQSPADRPRKIALVIGNAAYRGITSLANPANDATAVGDNLRGMGFEVSEGLDLGRAEMDERLRQFLLKAAGARTAFLFYAGHGVQIDGRNYLVPVDADLRHSSSIDTDMLALDTVLAGLQDSARANIVVLDACRDDPRIAQAVSAELGRSATVRAGLAAPSASRAASAAGAGTLVAFATAPGEIALDGDGRNSPFSSALTRHIGTPGLEVQQMFTRVRAEVVASTRSRQVPWTNSSLLGDVYLVGQRGVTE